MKIKSLQSLQNPAIKNAMKIKERPEKYAPSRQKLSGEVIVEGPGPISMAIEGKTNLQKVLTTEEFLKNPRYETLIKGIIDQSVPIYLLEDRLITKISDTKTPQGIIALCRVQARKISEIPNQKGEIFVVSDRIQDPGNTGTIIRVADGAGMRHFISLKGSVNPFNPKVIRASAGSIFNLNIVLTENEEFLNWCKDNETPIFITTTDAEKTIFDFEPSEGGAIVFGNETAGISEEIKAAALCSLRIPIYGHSESLNVASTAAIMIYELIRKRTCK